MSNELDRVLAMRRGEEPDHLSSAPEELDIGDSASMVDAGSSIAPGEEHSPVAPTLLAALPL
jgi:hypothetical protein